MAYDRPLAFSSPLCLGRLPAPQATQASELGNPAKKKPRSDFLGSDRGFPAVGRWSEGGETTTQRKLCKRRASRSDSRRHSTPILDFVALREAGKQPRLAWLN
jgi:hypothetical protein